MKFDKDSYEGWTNQGLALDNLGRSEEAIAAYEQALAEARQNANAIAGKARDAAKAEMDAHRRRIEADLQARLAVAGNVTDRWAVFAGYVYTRSDVLETVRTERRAAS